MPELLPDCNAATRQAIKAALATLPPCSAAPWSKDYVPETSSPTVVRVSPHGIGRVSATDRGVSSLFHGWPAVTGAGISEERGGCTLWIFSDAEPLLSIMTADSAQLRGSERSLPLQRILAAIFKAKGWT